MYGYKDLGKRSAIKVLLCSAIVIAFLVLFGLYLIHTKVLKTEEYIAAAVGLVAGVIAISAIFLQIRLTLRRNLEASAVADIQLALKQLTEDAAIAVTFSNDFVVKPLHIPQNFWQEKVYEKHDQIANETNKIRMGFGSLYVALETHEITVIHLERYYRYLTIRMGDFIERIERSNTEFLKSASTPECDENAYKVAVHDAFGKVMEEWADVVCLFMDFRKILQTDLLGKVFQRELQPRKPYDGSRTLELLATQEEVQAMVDAREAEFGKLPEADKSSQKFWRNLMTEEWLL